MHRRPPRLVTEIIQYACEKRTLTNMEANALLAGIMVDTNRFAVKAGVRTFEAASWLRRAGADLELYGGISMRY